MPIQTNENFDQLKTFLAGNPTLACTRSADTPEYKAFIAAYPLASLTQLSLDRYCVGKAEHDTFCRWIERGLEPAIGRYMPGTAKGHILYFKRDGSVYRHRFLAGLSDDEALLYTLKIQHAIAAADPEQDLSWIDDDKQVFVRAGVEPRVTVGEGRKLRLLACYHPDHVLPFSSSDHVAHFLVRLGFDPSELPPSRRPVARMLLLRDYYEAMKKSIPGLTPFGFMRALYDESLGLAPKSEGVPAPGIDPDLPLAEEYLPALNQILYGPPGTGKTYATVDAALEILAPEVLLMHAGDRASIKAHFDTLVNAGHIRFVTFHQSFSYEDFVEGLRAETDDEGRLQYRVVDGVFKSLCSAAAARVTRQADVKINLTGRRIWKMSLGNTQGSDAYIYDECIDKSCVLLGYGQRLDFGACKSRDDIHKRFVAADGSITKDAYAVTAVNTFVLKIKVGDLVVVTDGNSKFRAIGEFTGDYRFLDRKDEDNYAQCRDVRWLRVYTPSLPLDQLMNNQFSQMTLYELRPAAIDLEKLSALLGVSDTAVDVGAPAIFQVGDKIGAFKVESCSAQQLTLTKSGGKQVVARLEHLKALAGYVRDGKATLKTIATKEVYQKVPNAPMEPYLVDGYAQILSSLVDRVLKSPGFGSATSGSPRVQGAKVLIIDEINRGNVSRILGELITLIEPSKRAGMPEALEVTLPYSKERFRVPANLYLIGTMNTADRSLAGLDIALRRRFSFREMPPDPKLLDGLEIEGVKVGALLRAMNDRIEVLLDRDHCLGHAYFMGLYEKPTISELGAVFRLQVLPLLQEYFFEDWQRIQWVLNDHNKLQAEHRFLDVPANSAADLFGGRVNVNQDRLRWSINEGAFTLAAAYIGTIQATSAVA